MSKLFPEMSKQIRSQDIRSIIEKNFISIIPAWVPLQLSWVNGVYRTFHDYEKFMIIMHLLMKTFDFYSKTFVKLNYEEFFYQNSIEVEKINIMEISISLNIPKETTRRKVNELVEMGSIKRIDKKFTINRDTWPNIKPEETIKRMSRFYQLFQKCVLKRS